MHPNSLANLKQGGIEEHNRANDYRGVGRRPNWLRSVNQENYARLLDIQTGYLDRGEPIPAWVSKNLEVNAKYSLAELKEISLDDPNVLAALSDVLGDMNLDDKLAMDIYDRFVQRCKEV